MKGHKTYHTFLLSLLLVVVASCKKDEQQEEKLPPLTHEGKDTFGCLVNGEVWVAKTPFSVGGPVPLFGQYESDSGDVQIYATLKDKELGLYEFIKLNTEGVYSVGKYDLRTRDIDKQPILGFGDVYENYSCSAYYHDSLNPGTITITYFNPDDYIISGTFEMTLKNSECEDSLMYITEGRFDLGY